jgi:hypothetical protein
MALQYHSVQRPAAAVNTNWTRSGRYFVRYPVTPELRPSPGVTEEWVEGGALAKLAKRFGSRRFLG